ncbi:MAG: hypothetical protein QM703_24340 [Gemmatales bacterium]
MKRSRIFALVILSLLISSGVLFAGMWLFVTQKPRTFAQVEDLLEWEAETLLSDPTYAQQFIRTGQPNPLYNCHGWTFTQGQRDVTDDEVDKLLQSGRYRKVTVPISGDIVIYYDNTGNLCHSGIVKATGRQGFVLVESKWGEAGRFLHLLSLPQVQAKHEFYRRNSQSGRNARNNNAGPLVPSQ